MRNADCVALLRWALPRLGLRWPGFRKVRGQVYKRIGRRINELGLASVAAYRAHLERVPEEWSEFDALCRITISRFYRDNAVFEYLGETVLPALAAAAAGRDNETLRCWSAGCGSGEEPYSLVLLWSFRLAHSFPDVSLEVVATDADGQLLERAARGCYSGRTLRELPSEWIRRAFVADNGNRCLHPVFRESVLFLRQDIRTAQPEGPFDLVLCRNLVFTYFEPALQRRMLAAIAANMRPGAALVVGKDEALPPGEAFEASTAGFGVYRKDAA